MGFLSSVAKVVGIAAAPFTGGTSLALTAAAMTSDAQKKAASANVASASQQVNAIKTQAEADVEKAKIEAETAEKQREHEMKLVQIQTDALLKQTESSQVVNDPMSRLMSKDNTVSTLKTLALAGMGYYIIKK